MGLYVQYGCGSSAPEGWENFDASPTLRLQRLPVVGSLLTRGQAVFPPAVKYGDIRDGLPLAPASADAVYASHVLEHLAYQDFFLALRNTYDLLKPGGYFRLIVPDLEERARRYVTARDRGEADASAQFLNATMLGIEKRDRNLSKVARQLLGNSQHLWMWDEGSIRAALEKVGFVDIRRCRFNDSAEPAFAQVEEHSRFYDEELGVEECAMEARKPG